MERKDLNILANQYASTIKSMIKDNARFYYPDTVINWRFGYDEDASIVAACNRKDNIITINLKSVKESFSNKDTKTIEYFLLHEIRHIFQHEIIKKHQNGIEIELDTEIVEKWIYESTHYVKSKNENGDENPDYFNQDSEMDAYAYSYAVMKYKYKTVDLYVPPVYGDEFYNIVNMWIDLFTSEKL